MGLFDFFKQEDINQGIEEYKKTPGVHKIKKGGVYYGNTTQSGGKR